MCRPARLLGVRPSINLLGDLRSTHPHFVYTPHGEANRRLSTMPAVWPGVPARAGEAPEYTGMDVIIVRDGKIAALYVFLDSIPS